MGRIVVNGSVSNGLVNQCEFRNGSEDDVFTLARFVREDQYRIAWASWVAVDDCFSRRTAPP